MLKSIENFIRLVFDSILPPRNDFEIVKRLDEKAINTLPSAPQVENLDWIHPLFHYKDNRVRAMIWELKYKDNTRALEHVAIRMYEEIIDRVSNISLFDTDAQFVLLPIPISNERRIERGYNQSEYICRAIVQEDLGHILLYAPQWFAKIKETATQNKAQTKQERLENLTGCFSADPRVLGKYIILIDDVVTTGSTLSEARKTLLEAGAKDVFAFTIAH